LTVLSALERLASHPLLDRLIRGRAWLVLVTFALIGIVTLQLALLKLNGSVGRALRSEAVLQRENATLSIENSELQATDHVQAGGVQLGMAFASSSALRFLAPSSHGDLTRGASALSSPLHATGSSEGGSSRASAASAGEASETSASEKNGSEAQAERKSSEARSGEGGGSSPSSSESETSASPARGAEAGAQSAASPSPESSSAASSSPAGGTEAAPHG
jgi:hypothetical protein